MVHRGCVCANFIYTGLHSFCNTDNVWQTCVGHIYLVVKKSLRLFQAVKKKGDPFNLIDLVCVHHMTHVYDLHLFTD